jgi:hypothetical protein
MPGSTPNYAIPFPCGPDTINTGVFASYAQGVQSALTAVNGVQSQLLRPPAALIRRSTVAQSIPAGAATAATFEYEGYDTDNLYDPAVSNAQFQIRTAGSYLISYGYSASGLPTTLTSIRTAIVLNAGVAELAYSKSDEGAGAFNVDNEFWISAFAPSLARNDLISFQILFTGTGNMSVIGTASIVRLSTT